MFERYTERARRCIYFGRQTAVKYGSQTIETEHLLLGILREDPDVISRFLPSKTANEIRAEVVVSAPDVEIGLSLYCKRILAYAADEAERLHHRHIDLGHLLTGVVREEDGIAGEILRSAGLNEALRDGYRAKAFLMTKIDGRSKESATRQLDESLKRFGVDQIDLVQHHEILRYEDPHRIFDPDGANAALIRAREAGKIRYIGFTGHKDPRVHLYMLEVAEQNKFVFDRCRCR